ncbi:helix-turn-helix domain-containing protein [bacterium]|nr:helix-turn-helix domain-containing protein [bacterium]
MELVTLEEAARRLRVSRATLYRWSREGRLTLCKLGPRATRIREQDLAGLESSAKPVHCKETKLWLDAQAIDLGRALAEWEHDIPSGELDEYYLHLAKSGISVRWNESLGEYEEIPP